MFRYLCNMMIPPLTHVFFLIVILWLVSVSGDHFCKIRKVNELFFFLPLVLLYLLHVMEVICWNASEFNVFHKPWIYLTCSGCSILHKHY